jgi:putative transposase
MRHRGRECGGAQNPRRWRLAVDAVGHAAWRTVYGWFRRWAALGLFERMMRELTRLRRRAVGRRPSPHLAIIDTQTVKCLSVRRPRGYDAAKRLVGRKRVAMVDADGNWLAVVVVPASVQERDTLPALDQDKTAWPGLQVRRASPSCPGDGSSSAASAG